MKLPHTIRRHRRVLASLAAAAAIACLPGEAALRGIASRPVPAHASGPAPATLAGRTAASPTAPGAAGRIIALDPETGQLGAPSPEQLRTLGVRPEVAAVSRTDEGLVETRLTDGTVILDLGGRFQDNVIARLDRNGRLVYGCVHDDGKRPKAVPDSVPASALEER
jgi:hypothetical protein